MKKITSFLVIGAVLVSTTAFAEMKCTEVTYGTDSYSEKGREFMKQISVLFLIFTVLSSPVLSKKHYISDDDDSHPAF